MIEHYKTCTDKYPEKIENEPAKHITETDLGDFIIRQCVDCGAFEEIPKDRKNE